MNTPAVNMVMSRVKDRFERSGLSLEELGRKMGYGESARKSAWQFLNRTKDPRLRMLLKFAEAVEISPGDLFNDDPAQK